MPCALIFCRNILWVTGRCAWATGVVLAAFLFAAPAAAASWVVDGRKVSASPDGSADSPFRTIGRALEAAGDGDEIEVRPGLYPEALRIRQAVVLRGSGLAVVVAPDADDVVIAVEAGATLEGLSVQGGRVGVEVRGAARLRGLRFSAQRRAAVLIEGARAEVEGGTLSASFDRNELVGIDVLSGGTLVARGVRLEGPFRFGIRAREASLDLADLEVVGATVAVGCVEGCRGRLVRSVLAQGRGVGLLVGAGRMEARDNLVSRFEQCITVNHEGELTLADTTTAFCELAGIGAFGARVAISHHLHLGPSRTAAIELMGSQTRIREAVLLNPGQVGLGMRGGTAEVDGLLVRGAAADREGLFGEGVFVMDARLTLRSAWLEANAGTALTALRSTVNALDLEAWFNRTGGVAAQDTSHITLTGAALAYNLGPGLVAVEDGQVVVAGGLLRRNGEGPASADCGASSSIELRGVSIEHPPSAPCIRIVPHLPSAPGAVSPGGQTASPRL